MQTNCPQCSQKLVVEDDKVPAGPFMLRCPKCQKTLKLPGKGGAATSPPSDKGAPAAKSSPAQTKSPPAVPPVAPAPPPVVAPSPVAPSSPGDTGGARALISVTNPSDPTLQRAVASLLQKSGYGVDVATEAKQGVQLLERTSYAVVVTSRNGKSGPDQAGNVSLYKRVVALAPEIRRNLFLVLLGTEFSSGDGTEAFAAMADLVLNPKDVANAEDLLRSTVNERARLFQAFQEAQVRLDRRKY